MHADVPFTDQLHVATLRGLVVLHFVRSQHYRDFERSRAGLVGKLISNYGPVDECEAGPLA